MQCKFIFCAVGCFFYAGLERIKMEDVGKTFDALDCFFYASGSLFWVTVLVIGLNALSLKICDRGLWGRLIFIAFYDLFCRLKIFYWEISICFRIVSFQKVPERCSIGGMPGQFTESTKMGRGFIVPIALTAHCQLILLRQGKVRRYLFWGGSWCFCDLMEGSRLWIWKRLTKLSLRTSAPNFATL